MTNNDPVQNNEPIRKSKPTIRSRLLLAVNLPLAALAVVFLAYDYSHVLTQRLEDKRIALEEEANTLLPAVLQVRQQGTNGVQQYIDTVCGQMQSAHSPGHHIVVELKEKIFQAPAHHRASPEILQAMREAAGSTDRLASYGEMELIVGSYKRDGAIVYVSETLEDLRGSVRSDVLRRLSGFFILAAVAAVAVNLVLIRVVTNPLHQLVVTVQEIGKGRLGVQTASFPSEELDFLATEINAMSSSLAVSDRYRKTQMAKARDIQRNLLPLDFHASGVEVAHIFEPADDVGGDYYDILPLRDGAWLFCVADVAGHGIPAAMTAAMLKTLLWQAGERFLSPAEMMSYVNERFISANLDGDFVTMMLVCITPQTGILQYASAGHEPAWLLSDDGKMQDLSSTGLVLGIEAETAWDLFTINFTAGDRLLIATDGVSETYNSEEEMFGRERLANVLAESGQLSVEQTAARINEKLKAFRGDSPSLDDVTLVLVEMTEGKRE